MSDSWNIEALRQYISAGHVPESPSLEIVDSLDRYVRIFVYHLISARDAMKEVIHTNDPYGIENTKYLFGASERQEDFYKAMTVTEANTLGCIHATRAIYDVFSQLLNHLLLSGELSERACSIVSVEKLLPRSDVKQILTDLLSSQWFAYVSAFINTAKHRRLVGQLFHVSFESPSARVEVPAFAYEGQSFASHTLEEILRGVVDVKNAVVHCGRALNSQLGVAAG